ncbi:MAG: HAD-IA family hydrolase [Spirochaetes bacterium]|nr:HAD-IA family hydrolase [Spirochaetota bacterium]
MNTLIFDLDGTLIDSFEDIADAINKMLAELHLPVRENEVIYSYIGVGLEYLIEKATAGSYDQKFLDNALAVFRKHYKGNMVNKTRCYPGVESVLRSLSKKDQLFILTNKNVEFSSAILKKLGILSLFKEVFGPPKTPRIKPDPAGIALIIEKYKSDTGSVYMIGDNYTDIEAGKNAGIRTVFCEYGRGILSEKAVPDFRIKEFKELNSILP